MLQRSIHMKGSIVKGASMKKGEPEPAFLLEKRRSDAP